MIKNFKLFILFFLICNFVSCIKDDLTDDSPPISFIVAGHTYGNPINPNAGLHTPFVDAIPFINSISDLKYCFLTGDFLVQATQEYLDAANETLSLIDSPIHIAAGNHDRGDVFLNQFQRYYYSFENNNNSFIILSPTDWNIEGDQKDFLANTLNELEPNIKNVFIFLHELVWWDPQNIFGGIDINFEPHYPGQTNYWTEIEPILKNTNKDIYLFAGDLGATSQVSPYMYYQEEKIHYIASGMGGNKEDNFIQVNIDPKGEVEFLLYGINDDTPFELAHLTDYKLPE